MIHPSCKDRGTHNWDYWEEYPADADGKCLLIESGTMLSAMPVFHYRRSCQNMGCDVIELAEGLMPAGKNEARDMGGSEAIYRREEDK